MGVKRRIAYGAVFSGGGVGVLLAALAGVLKEEARLARKSIGPIEGDPPSGDGLWGYGRGEPIRLAVLGDSSAAGFGVHLSHQTPGAQLAAGLSAVAERPVRLSNAAVVGATAHALSDQVGAVLAGGAPDVVMILIGANDVKERIKTEESVRLLRLAVRRLRAAGAEVVVGTCPDLGTIKPLAQPLRFLARRWSREMAAAQTVAVVEEGGRTVSIGDILGPEFSARPAEMFGADRFHPSAEGYAAAAAVMLPSVCAALGVWPEARRRREEPLLRDRVRPVHRAATRAANLPGTEVSAAEVRGEPEGPSGAWARLRRRRPRPMPDPRRTQRA